MSFPMIERLLAKRRSGYTLPQQFYIDADVFDFDLQAIFHSHWLQVALEIEIPNTGDCVTQTVGRSPTSCTMSFLRVNHLFATQVLFWS